MRTMPAGSVDAVVTDPPYPGREDLFNTAQVLPVLSLLTHVPQRLVFWPCAVAAPHDPDAVHIWHKAVPIHPFSQVGNVAGHQYEQILAYGLGARCLVFRVAAIMPNFAACKDEFALHPTQKPLDLLRALLEMLPPGATVFDPFMGSGTTGVACVRTGRNFIGCEIDPTYYAIAQRRIAEAQLQPPLFPHEATARPEQLTLDNLK
jgi:hypothetical protein